MRLEITQDHIDTADRARAGDPQTVSKICPVAQALMGMGYEEVKVRYGVTVAIGHRWMVLGQTWMHDWDLGEPVYPVTLELEEAT